MPSDLTKLNPQSAIRTHNRLDEPGIVLVCSTNCFSDLDELRVLSQRVGLGLGLR